MRQPLIQAGAPVGIRQIVPKNPEGCNAVPALVRGLAPEYQSKAAFRAAALMPINKCGKMLAAGDDHMTQINEGPQQRR